MKNNSKVNFLTCFFVLFGPWAPELLGFDLNIGFLAKSNILCQLEISRIPKCGQQTMIFGYILQYRMENTFQMFGWIFWIWDFFR